MIPRVLEQLQRGLERLYRLEPAPHIRDFLVDDHHGQHARPEQLLIVEEDDLYLGVSLDTSSLGPLADALLMDTNLEPFCIAVEGVSHFLFVIHRVRQQQPTTILELELQAEVDKYVACLLLLERCPSLPSERLRRRLYDGYRLHRGLSIDEQRRYHHANTLARRYARRLERRFLHHRRLPAMLVELRRFFRMTYRAKRELIHRAA